ncbi:MAG: hypothetical protein KC731_02080, partial [Myxococcales bacterium]|nr:hypothetical protein [Myxococcales bacterium]
MSRASARPASRHAAAKVLELLTQDLVSYEACVAWARGIDEAPRWVRRLAESKDQDAAIYGLRRRTRRSSRLP